MAPTEEELEKVEAMQEVKEGKEAGEKEENKVKKTAKKKKHHSRRYADALIRIDRNRLYPLSEALELLKNLDSTKFDQTVEVHVNTLEKGISGQVKLPHGSGREVRVAIANPSSNGQFTTLLSNIEKGVIPFDVLIAHPQAMPKLAKVAKILGPRGLMPNPKAGTISDTPEEVAEKFRGGQMQFKTESQAPIIHARVGKVSFEKNDLSENIIAFLRAIGVSKIKGVTLKSTMSPGIKVDIAGIS
jgi:large subunit ribosomal protein L1